MKKISTIAGILVIIVAAIILFCGFFAYQNYFNPKSKALNSETNQLQSNSPEFLFEINDLRPGVNVSIKNAHLSAVIQNIILPHIDLSFFTKLTVKDIVIDDNDINFDGYKDLQVLVSIPASNGGVFDFYIYDPSAQKFGIEESLHNLVSPTFNSNSKVITTYQSGGCAGQFNEQNTYSFIDGKYILTLKKEASCCVMQGKDNGGSVVVTQLKNGKMETKNEMCPVDL